ncbi:MAG TPA: hypothetical protein VHR66_30205 [Gemmataceae bacterium]|jgi:hypothetical protein|nr:hypothetical protein [Gemmataceae bacterium]
MSRLLAVAAAVLVLPLFAPADPPAPPTSNEPIGGWQVKFANGVVETCVFEQGKANETEPLRTSTGKLEVQDGSVVIAFEDDRTERWTAVGNKWVVEHWFPSSSYPASRPVVGIAKRQP